MAHTHHIIFSHDDATETDYILPCSVQWPFCLVPVYFCPYGHQPPNPPFVPRPGLLVCLIKGYLHLRAFAFVVSSAWSSLPPDIHIVCSLMPCWCQLRHCFVSECFLTTQDKTATTIYLITPTIL